MSFASSLKEKIQAHKLVASLAGAVAVAGICVGGFFGWQEYQYRQSPAYAVENLKKYLVSQNAHELALTVDFKSLCADMTDAAKKTFPFLAEKKDPDRFLSHNIQKTLLHKFMEKEHKSQFPEDESEVGQLKKPLALLPADFVSQLAAKAECRQLDDNLAELRVKIDNPQLKEEFPLVFRMEKGDRGWMVNRFENAQETAALLRQALLKRYAALRNVYLDKNAATTKEMNRIIPIQGCTADAGLLSDRKTFVFIIRTVARNKGDIQVNNLNLDATITGKSGKIILRRFLNDAQPVIPGEVYDHRWSVDLDSASPLARALLQDGPLHCQATWQTLALNNGKVLHIDEVPNPTMACLKAGHDHPAAFCELPLFQY